MKNEKHLVRFHTAGKVQFETELCSMDQISTFKPFLTTINETSHDIVYLYSVKLDSQYEDGITNIQ